jgi:hypothetical protein
MKGGNYVAKLKRCSEHSPPVAFDECHLCLNYNTTSGFFEVKHYIANLKEYCENSPPMAFEERRLCVI